MFRRLVRYALCNFLGFGTITHVETKKNFVSLTFDDGPNPDFTPQLLNILKRYNAKATFFVLGKNARRHPNIVKRAIHEGHAIGNHSFDHPSFPLITGKKRIDQIRSCQKEILKYTIRILRPPFGHQTLASRFSALLLGYSVIGWSAHGEDWLDHDADTIAASIEDGIRPGSIILLHDNLNDVYKARYADRKPTLDAVDIILERLSGRFHFVTIPEILKNGEPNRSYWMRKCTKEWYDSLNTVAGNECK